MAYLASIGKLSGDGGLFDILTESDVYAEGTSRQLLQGKQLARGVRSIKLASEAPTSPVLGQRKFLQGTLSS